MVTWVYETSKLQEHYLNYYGEGEKALNKISTTQGFIFYTTDLKFSPSQLVSHIKNLDSTRGAEDDRLIVMSTVYKTKGLEYDYVIIPDCNEGSMPYISDNQMSIFDKLKPNSITNLSDSLENERRLFYVAITRAKKLVMIGTNADDKTRSSRFLEEILISETKSVLFPLIHGESLDIRWLEKIKVIAGRKKILENVRKYLYNLGHTDSIPQMDSVTLSVPEEEFTYKNAYASKIPLEPVPHINDNDPWKNVRV